MAVVLDPQKEAAKLLRKKKREEFVDGVWKRLSHSMKERIGHKRFSPICIHCLRVDPALFSNRYASPGVLVISP